MMIKCLLCQKMLPSFHVFPRKALFTKPLESPVRTAVADMGLAYCRECRHISSRIETQISQECLKQEVYGELYRNFAPTELSPLQQAYTDFVEGWLAGYLSPVSRVLEVGCHDGYLLNQLAERGHLCEGVEPSPFGDLARKKYNLPIVKDFFHSEQFDKDAYDLVVIRHVVEHVEDPIGFVADAAQVVKKGGLLYVEVPNSYYSVQQTYFPEFHVDHISYFTTASLLRLLDMCGLKEIVHQETVWAYMKFPFINVLARKTSGRQLSDARPAKWFFDFRIEHLLDRFVEKYVQLIFNLRTVCKGRNLVVWGTGSIGIQYAIDAGWSRQDVTYVDVNPANQGLVLSVTGHYVHSPEIIQQRQFDTVLIASGWEEDIRKQVQPYLSADTRVLGFNDLLTGAIE